MAANYLHGVETIDINDGARQIRTVKSATIGLIGTAPIYLLDAANQSINTPQLITSDKTAAAYGGTVAPGFTIPEALAAIYDQGAGIVAMVNVFDPAKHKRAITGKSITFVSGVAAFDSWAEAENISSPLLVMSVALDGFAEGVDFEFDRTTGNIIAIDGGGISAGDTAQLAADIADVSLVTAADIIGAVDVDGVRSGMQALLDVQAMFNFKPYTNIAPGFSSENGVSAALQVLAGKLQTMAILDAPAGASFQDVIKARGTTGTFDMKKADERVIYVYPHVKVYDSATDADKLVPYSAYFAGVMARVDTEEGYWVSPSNHQINGITGMELPLTASISDPNSEVNLLNEQGVVAIFTGFGTGYLAWGNRSSAYPASTHPYNFICVRKMADIVGESIEQAMLQFMDMGINNAFISQVVETVNSFIRTLVSRGAVVGGSCWYDPEQNEPTQISGGQLVFDYDLTPTIPCERITFRRHIDISRLAGIGQE